MRNDRSLDLQIKMIYAAIEGGAERKLLRKRIAEAKAIPARTERQVKLLEEKLAQIGALVILHEKEIFGRITRRQHKPEATVK